MKTQIIKYLVLALAWFSFGYLHGTKAKSIELNKELDTSLETCHYELKQCRFMYKQGE